MQVSVLVSDRTLHHADELARALADKLAIEIPVIIGTLADAPATGYLVVFELPITSDTRSGPRIIALYEDRSMIMKKVEAFSLAAAVEKQRYFEWCTRRSDERGFGLVGRKDVAARMGARVMSSPYTSTHYAALASDAAPDLVALIAAYLTAYAQVVSL